ncbi:MAG: phosphonate C-P lyase system protein PhnG, partial [Pseudomonadota bacterium]
LVGHSMILGRDHRKAKIAAIIDAVAQDPLHAERIYSDVVEPLKARIAARDEKRAAETAATKVDFFTMVRGDD